MGKHRNKLEILANVLSVISNTTKGAKKTQIMYQAYLSYKLLLRYLHVVTEAGLVKSEDVNVYKLTPKGEDFLTKYNQYHKSRESVNKKIDHVEDQKSILENMCSNNNTANVQNNKIL